MRAATSIPTLYCQRDPGWKASGNCARSSIASLSGTFGVEELRLLDHAADRRVFEKMVGEAARMRHQVRNEIGRTGSTSAVGAEHLHGREGREVGGDRIDEPDTPFLQESHQRGADDRLGHRVEAEDRVLRHRRARLLVAPAELSGMHDLAVPRDQRAHARKGSAFDIGQHAPVDPLEAAPFIPALSGASICMAFSPLTVRPVAI